MEISCPRGFCRVHLVVFMEIGIPDQAGHLAFTYASARRLDESVPIWEGYNHFLNSSICALNHSTTHLSSNAHRNSSIPCWCQASLLANSSSHSSHFLSYSLLLFAYFPPFTMPNSPPRLGIPTIGNLWCVRKALEVAAF